MTEPVSGFHGEITGLSLADVIQIKSHNRYSGCIQVEYQDQQGNIYFVLGEIVHAEQELLRGEEALYAILTWTSGNFRLTPATTPVERTIHHSLGFLLLEAHRRIDEKNHTSEPSFEEVIEKSERRKEPRSPAPQQVQRPMSAAAARVMQVKAVTYAVLLDKQGEPVQDTSADAEALAAKTELLARAGNTLGGFLGMGELKSVVVQSHHFDLLMYDSKLHYLGVSVVQGSAPDVVETGIRAALAPGK
jgi:predicted regulator of Ras-like GTPase activity (Roadblock/LC7/MglB family)